MTLHRLKIDYAFAPLGTFKGSDAESEEIIVHLNTHEHTSSTAKISSMKMANHSLPSLLILPPAPQTPAALKAAYHPALTAALTTLASIKASKAAVLELYVPCPRHYPLDEPRSHLFEGLVSGVYSLACIISAHNTIEPDGSGGVDTRVILLDYNSLEEPHDQHLASPFLLPAAGPIIDIQTLALTRRNWNWIFSVDGGNGQEILNKYLGAAAHLNLPVQGEIFMVSGGVNLMSSVISKSRTAQQGPMVHTVVIVGGTFDHLHAGHKLLLTATALLLQPWTPAMDVERRLVIGITGDQLLKNKKYAEYLQSWKQRYNDVVDFLLSILFFAQPEKQELETQSFDEPRVNGKAIHTRLKQARITIECVEIQDPFGPTITDETVSALVVSRETRSGGAAVNTKREEKGWKPLEVFEVDVLDALEDKPLDTETEEFAAKISSTAIRKRKAESAHKPSL
jgi:phosphopantetheine adenylyltransferase